MTIVNDAHEPVKRGVSRGHPLKEVDAEAQAWCTTTDQVVEILRYVLKA